MKLLEQAITKDELKKIAALRFITLVKAVVDIEREIMVIDADLHADQEAYLLKHGSNQDHLWGINLLVDNPVDSFIQYDSMINLRPNQGNMTRSVENKDIQEKIINVVNRWVSKA